MPKLPSFKSKFFLAPMSGISDAAFRLLCSELGAGLTTTELTSVHAICYKGEQLKKEQKMISEFVEFSQKESPRSIQLFGFDFLKQRRMRKSKKCVISSKKQRKGCEGRCLNRLNIFS